MDYEEDIHQYTDDELKDIVNNPLLFNAITPSYAKFRKLMLQLKENDNG